MEMRALHNQRGLHRQAEKRTETLDFARTATVMLTQ